MRWIARWYDRLGLSLVAAFATWTLVSAAAAGSNPLPQLMAIVLASAAYAVGRSRGSTRPVFVAAAVVLIILASAVASGPDAVAGGPTGPPMGYGNANGALYTLGVAAAAMVSVSANRDIVREPAGALAVIMLAYAALTTSKAATILSLAILAIAIAAHRVGRWLAVAGPLFIAGAIGVTLLIGLVHDAHALSGLVSTLAERRTVLWDEAMTIAADNPLLGTGPGTFATTSPTAISDEDARWAHSEYLQVAAETGLLGAFLLCTILAWVFGSLYRSQQDARIIVIGIAVTTAFCIHAGIDYVAHFPALVFIASLLAGLASSRANALHNVKPR